MFGCATFARQLVAADVVAEHDDLVAATRQRVDDVDRLRERRVVGVDDLGEEDEPHGRSVRGAPA